MARSESGLGADVSDIVDRMGCRNAGVQRAGNRSTYFGGKAALCEQVGDVGANTEGTFAAVASVADQFVDDVSHDKVVLDTGLGHAFGESVDHYVAIPNADNAAEFSLRRKISVLRPQVEAMTAAVAKTSSWRPVSAKRHGDGNRKMTHSERLVELLLRPWPALDSAQTSQPQRHHIAAVAALSPIVVTIVSASGLDELNVSGDALCCSCEIIGASSSSGRSASAIRCRTHIVRSLDPVWEEENTLLWQPGDDLKFILYDEGLSQKTVVGRAFAPSRLFASHGFEGALQLSGTKKAMLKVRIRCGDSAGVVDPFEEQSRRPEVSTATSSTCCAFNTSSGRASPPFVDQESRAEVDILRANVAEEQHCLDAERKKRRSLQEECDEMRELRRKESPRIKAQHAEQHSASEVEDLMEQLSHSHAYSDKLHDELEDSRREVAAITAARRQLTARLDSREGFVTTDAERRLQVAHMELDDLRCQCNEGDSNLTQLRSQNDYLHRELRRTRIQLEETREQADARHRLSAELVQCEGELVDFKSMRQQDQRWIDSLKQENDQLLADLRAAGEFSDSLSKELKGAGDKVQSHHAKCCQLWVALENERLETQRLRDSLVAARRETTIVSEQLQQHQHQLRMSSNGADLTHARGMFTAVDGPRWEARQTANEDRSLDVESSRSSRESGAYVYGGAQIPLGGAQSLLAGSLLLSAGGASGADASPTRQAPRVVPPLRNVRHSLPAFPVANGLLVDNFVGTEPRTRAGQVGVHHLQSGWESPLEGDHALLGELGRYGSFSPPAPPIPNGCATCDGVSVLQNPSLDTDYPLGQGSAAPLLQVSSNRDMAGQVNARSSSPSATFDSSALVAKAVGGKDSNVDSIGRLMRQGLQNQEVEVQRERQVSAIEKKLSILQGEKQLVENLLLKFPSNSAGRTLAERRQKRDAEDRLLEINNGLKTLRRDLRQTQLK